MRSSLQPVIAETCFLAAQDSIQSRKSHVQAGALNLASELCNLRVKGSQKCFSGCRNTVHLCISALLQGVLCVVLHVSVRVMLQLLQGRFDLG